MITVYSHEQLLESILFKYHRRRIYSHLRIALIAEHPSLSLQSGVVACCNSLKAINIWDSVQLNHPYGTFSKFPEQAKEK